MTTQNAMPLRAPETVMRLKRLGAFHQCRLSFMRVLTRRIAREHWSFKRATFEIDAQGVGYAVYTAQGPVNAYSLVAFAHDLPDEQRSDRVIAEAWDATFTLFDGIPTKADIARLKANVPLQEAGRISESELTLARANRSVRLWKHVVATLADGVQPDPDFVLQVGYLMRTTAVYGSGKFGAADRELIADRSEMEEPFQAEMLTVYLIRSFVRDLVEHMALQRGGAKAVGLDPTIAASLGIGNSTGLGMAPFLINHPILFNNWIIAREEAIARVRALKKASLPEQNFFRSLVERSARSVAVWGSEHPEQRIKINGLIGDIALTKGVIAGDVLRKDWPWNGLMEWAETALSEEGQEWFASLMLEPYGALVDGLSHCMSDANTEALRIDGAMTVGDTRSLIEASFGWALDVDWSEKDATARAWYVSEEKLEPRLGERFEEPIAQYEQPLAPARDACLAHKALADYADSAPIAEFLLTNPDHRHTIRRAQMSRFAPYGEIHDNTISAALMPIDMLRAKLSFFGATHFDPRSDRWVRICMFAGAPYPVDLRSETADFWIYPEVGT